MKNIYGVVRIFILVIAILMLLSGIILTGIGGYEFAAVFPHFASHEQQFGRIMAIDLLHAVDLFLVSIVFFVLSLGILVLFSSPDKPLPVKLPDWLKIKTFMQLKVILWEAILTTLVVAYLASLAERGIEEKEITIESLIVPAGILLVALSLFFLKKGEGDSHKNN